MENISVVKKVNGHKKRRIILAVERKVNSIAKEIKEKYYITRSNLPGRTPVALEKIQVVKPLTQEAEVIELD